MLMYHRVVDLGPSANGLCVTPQHFAQHLQVLRKLGRPMHLDQLVRSLQYGTLPHRGVAITFDDGYADNFLNAKPLLETHDVPATVFVTAGNVGTDREFWWDDLERILLQPGTLPEVLRLRVQGRAREWHLNEAVSYSEPECQQDRLWRIEQAKFPSRRGSPSARFRLFDALFGLVYALPAPEKRAVLDALCEWAGREKQGRSTHRSLSSEELVHLASNELVAIGAHTEGHVALGALPVSIQQDEILRSKVFLEDVLGRRVVGLSYPHGSYNAQTVAATKKLGLAYACTTDEGTVWRRTDPFRLPRLYVPDEDADAFASRLGLWLR